MGEGKNLAVTEDGAKYNKLERPDDLLPTPQSEEDVVVAQAAPEASTKRKLDDNDAAGIEPERKKGRKRLKDDEDLDQPGGSGLGAEVRRNFNPEYGRQEQFPGIDEDNFSDGSMNEAMAYLRSVRTEASTIPKLLVAAPAKVPEGEFDTAMFNSCQDMRGYYEDGAYIAREHKPTVPAFYTPALEPELDIQEAYYNRLLTRYKALRVQLEQVTGTTLAERMEADPSLELKQPPKNRHEWLYILDREYPTATQLAQLQTYTIFKGLGYCTMSLSRFGTITPYKSCWIWSLLGKVRDYGTLNNSQVGIIRDLAKKAGNMGLRMRGVVAPEEDEESEAESVVGWEPDEGQELSASKGEAAMPSAVLEKHTTDAPDVNVDDDGRDKDKVEAEPGPVQPPTAPENHTIDTSNVNMDIDDDGDTPMAISSSSSEDGEISEDEGKPTENGTTTKSPPPANNSSALEAAKARLLAQLGSRLIREHTPEPPSASQEPRFFESRLEAEQFQRNSLRNSDAAASGDVALQELEAELELEYAAADKAEQEALKSTTDAPPRSPSSSPVLKPMLSRFEAEALRQKQRDDELAKLTKKKQKAKVIDDDAAQLNTRITIDMILTVVAECFGQRDLLRFRERW